MVLEGLQSTFSEMGCVMHCTWCQEGSQWVTFRSRDTFLKKGEMVTEVWFKRLSHCHTAACNSFWNKAGVG